MDETTTSSPTGTQAPPPGPGPRVSRDDVKDLGRLRRSVTDRHIAGVAGGLARHLDVDPIIVRVVLVVAVFFGGAGLLAYVGAWILVPEEGTDDQPLGLDVRNRSLALTGVGILALLCAVGDWAGAFWFPWPLAIAAAVVLWFLNRKRSHAPSGYGHDPQPPNAPTGWSDPTTGETGTTDPTRTTTYGTATGWVSDDRGTRRREQVAAYVRERPRNPRKRGPILFLFTLALIALAEGTLGVVDLAGASVTGSAYPALALGITALMLVVGSFWGRAGGLVALGLVAALATAGTTVGENIDSPHVEHAPTTAQGVQDSYDFGGGNFSLDLSGIDDVAALDGRDITIDGLGGRVEVVVPDGVDVDVDAQVVGGDVTVFDRHADGFDITQDGSVDGGAGAPQLSITIDLVGGEVIVRQAA